MPLHHIFIEKMNDLTSALGNMVRTWKIHPKYPPFHQKCLPRRRINNITIAE